MPSPSPPEADDTDSDLELEGHRQEEEEQDLDGNDDDETLGDDLVGLGADEEDEEEEGDEELDDEEALGSPNHAGDAPLPNLDPPPPYLREISTLASWTVSSSKPGCSIPQLRHPNTNLFWQSDGPQPHYLNIHFFKLVRIVGLRLYLDFEQDESYTPTKIIFLAGSGLNDLQEWGEMRLESPRGWIWADFSGVGDPDSDDDGDDDDDNNTEGRGAAGQQPQRLLGEISLLNGTRRSGNDAGSSDSENAAPTQGADVTDLDLDLETPAHQQQQQQQHTPFPPYPTNTHTHNHMYTTPQTVPPSHTHNLRHYTHTVTPTQHQPSTPSLPQTISRPHPRAPFASLSPNPAPRPIPSSTQSTPKLPVLRAHLVQIKILENHQNGKDTHLRGLQIFARNDEDGQKAGGHGAGSNITKGVTSGAQGVELLKREKKEKRLREEVLELGGGIMGMGLGEGSIR
jgi:anaphase-promoting complex subunit 10